MDSIQCKICSAPMALTRDAVHQGRKQHMVSILGESNVGKTVYLGFLLDMLSQRAGDFEAVPVGPYSINVQQNVVGHMAARVFPPKTPMEADQWNWAYYQICKHRSGGPTGWIDLVMPDMAGESIAAEVTTPETFRVISSLTDKSEGMMLLLDAALAANGSSQPDFFGLKMLTYVDTITRTARDQLIQTPTAVVLCKADHCPEAFDDPCRFAEANLNRTWNLCHSRLACFEFFACSVVGSLGYGTSPHEEFVVPVPLHTALRGVLEPFEWVIEQIGC
jgi:hypothetical protein